MRKLFGGSQDEAIIDADDMSKKENVVLKLKSVLEISSKKFGDTYKDVKIPMATAALLQLVNQAKAQQANKQHQKVTTQFALSVPCWRTPWASGGLPQVPRGPVVLSVPLAAPRGGQAETQWKTEGKRMGN